MIGREPLALVDIPSRNQSEQRDMPERVLLRVEQDTFQGKCDFHIQRQRNEQTSSPESSRHFRSISEDQTATGLERWRSQCELLQGKETQHRLVEFQLLKKAHRGCLCSRDLQEKWERGGQNKRTGEVKRETIRVTHNCQE
jgi:hypothetical protein